MYYVVYYVVFGTTITCTSFVQYVFTCNITLQVNTHMCKYHVKHTGGD